MVAVSLRVENVGVRCTTPTVTVTIRVTTIIATHDYRCYKAPRIQNNWFDFNTNVSKTLATIRFFSFTTTPRRVRFILAQAAKISISCS